MASMVPWDPASAQFEEEEARSIGLVSTSVMDDGTSSMYQKTLDMAYLGLTVIHRCTGINKAHGFNCNSEV
eukprot:11863103-Ditylum_brightwellii.AAC.1